jgi:hypothetical protein
LLLRPSPAAAVPYPRLHTVRYSGVLAPASKLRAKIAPTREPIAAEGEAECVRSAIACEMPDELPKPGPYRPWAELLTRTFHVDVLQCPNCQGRMRLLAVLNDGAEGVTYAASARGPSCQRKRRQGHPRNGLRVHSEDESSATKPRSLRPTADAKTPRQGEVVCAVRKCDYGKLRAANEFVRSGSLALLAPGRSWSVGCFFGSKWCLIYLRSSTRHRHRTCTACVYRNRTSRARRKARGTLIGDPKHRRADAIRDEWLSRRPCGVLQNYLAQVAYTSSTTSPQAVGPTFTDSPGPASDSTNVPLA